ncbi:hypothetical protein VNI00_004589 [Paramarasmius palmivorus]|uniref:DUF6534 domain-containing protein n=1 Tax=Paramarasmius palmivorus TaxID=297713 RepID=A0AAW0DK15_9AGAR
MVKGPAELAHGPMFIGGILTVLLFGISVTQTYIYWDAYKNKDRWFIKYFVLLLFVADAVHCVFIVIYLYDSVIRHFDDVSFLATSNWVFNTEPALSGMISGMVQAFFGWRVKVLTGSWILLAIIQICSAAAFLMGIATAIACGIVKSFAEFQKFQVVVIILTVQTGLITAIWAMADLLVYLLDPTGTHLIFNCVLPKLYTNSLLSSLNSRGGWRFNDSENTSMKQSQNDIGLRRFGAHSENVVNLPSSRPEVFVHVESQETVDPSGKAVHNSFTDENKSGWKDSVAV